MSSSERSVPRTLRRLAVLFAVALLPLAAACTVKPLYSNPSAQGTQAGVTADLSSISIKPVDTRYAQQLRNHLIFLFNRGAGQPASAAYTLTLDVDVRHRSGGYVQIGEDNETTVGTVTMTARYALASTASGEAVATGRRQITSQYDKPRQEFAAYRARMEAEDRAARELAELLNLSIAQDLSRQGGKATGS